MSGYLRADGTRLGEADLAESVPMLPLELEDLSDLVGLVERWLLVASDEAREELADYLPGETRRDLEQVIAALGAASLQLHRLAHPPATSPTG